MHRGHTSAIARRHHALSKWNAESAPATTMPAAYSVDAIKLRPHGSIVGTALLSIHQSHVHGGPLPQRFAERLRRIELIWPTYPIGHDDRNEHDMIRSSAWRHRRCTPDGRTCTGAAVRVFPMMMWDQGTREPDKPSYDAITEIMKEIDADSHGIPRTGFARFLASEKVGHSGIRARGKPVRRSAGVERDDSETMFRFPLSQVNIQVA